MTPDPDPTAIDDSTDRLLASLALHEQRTQERLDATPKTKPCPDCGAEALLDPTTFWSDESTKRAVIIVPTEPKYHCPACVAKQAAENERKTLLARGIPADVLHATLANFEQRKGYTTGIGYASPAEFLSYAKDFLRGNLRNLILAGTCGIGKGHLAAAITKRFLAAKRRVRWTTCSRLFADYHRAYKHDATEQVIEPLIRCDLLVLDEIKFRDMPTDGEEILFAIIDPRTKAGKQTLMMGNGTAEETRNWLGIRILDRLKSGGLKFAYGQWPSARGTENDGAGI